VPVYIETERISLMERKNFTQKQLDVISFLIKHYPQGIGTDDPEIRRVADSIIDRDGGLVELIDSDETLSGDCYRLTDAGADAFRADAEERAREAENN
jgi:DNA-binding MarR family transcriptional regulator